MRRIFCNIFRVSVSLFLIFFAHSSFAVYLYNQQEDSSGEIAPIFYNSGVLRGDIVGTFTGASGTISSQNPAYINYTFKTSTIPDNIIDLYFIITESDTPLPSNTNIIATAFTHEGTSSYINYTKELVPSNSFYTFNSDTVYYVWMARDCGYSCGQYYLKSNIALDSFYGYISSEHVPTCTENCNDNILFLPGITGSKLYEDTPGRVGCTDTDGMCEIKRWLPILGVDSDVRKLYLDTNGDSVNSIHTKDVLDKASTQLFSLNIYKSFLDSLESWKNQEHIIADYSAVPYDWRFSASEVIARGKKSASGKISYKENLGQNDTPYILGELLRLVGSSRTGKVTIIAHSNGGLVAKELMLKLREMGKENLVNRLVLVAVPEVGTPDTIKTILHGDDIGPFGLISDSKLTREFVNNMPTAYDLLPSKQYFGLENNGINLVKFDNSQYFDNARNQYGDTIDTFLKLQNYLKNLESRVTPGYGDLNHASVLNQMLIDKSDVLHNRLDAWQPIEDTKVIELAGWGEYTVAGLGYRTEKSCSSYIIRNSGLKVYFDCAEYKDKQVLDITDTLEGDGTVVHQSAHYLSDKNISNTERWWIDLDKYNNILLSGSVLNISHKNIFEIPNLISFIKSKILNEVVPYLFVSQIKPTSNKQFVKVKLNSPLTLDVYDSLGNHTGVTASGQIEENIPGSRYRTIGESKYILVPKDLSSTVKLKGYEEGSFSLDIDNIEGDTVTSSTRFSAIPTSASTLVTIDIPANVGMSVSTPIQLDFNGDGTNDTELMPKLGEETIYDSTPPELKVTFDLTKKDVVFSGEDNIDTQPSVNIASSSIILLDKNNNKTIIPYIKYRDSATKLRFSFDKINRNDIITNIPNTNVVYDWKEKNNNLTDLDTRVTIKGVEKYVFSYKKATNTTRIKTKIGNSVTTSEKSGFVPVTMITNEDNLIINY